jgi:dephospho-CoA kinase
VVGADGQIDRVALARIVFGDPRQRQILEAIIHPRVRALERQQLDDAIRHKALVVFDVPLLYENGLDGWCDTVVVVTVDEPTRRARLAKSRGMTAEQVDARLASQMPQAEKAARAAHVIDNSGTRRETLAQVRRLLEKLFPSGLPPGLNLPGDHCLPPQDPA